MFPKLCKYFSTVQYNMILTIDMLFQKGMESIIEVYKHLDSIAVITIAPEIENAIPVCKELSQRGIIVSVGMKIYFC